MIRKYTGRDYDLVAGWCKKRGRPLPSPDALSDLGFIVDDRVAGWLYLTNSNVAMVENIIANPNSVPSLRRHSLKVLCGLLVDTALSLGYTNIFGISNHPSVQKICREMGFREAPFTVFALSEKAETGPEGDFE